MKNSGKVEICGVNTSTLPSLTDAEKRELLIRAHAGDTDARDRLVVGNLRLVLSIVGRFSGRRENPEDLFQVGCIGLIKAIDNFNTNYDVKLSTYACPMICGEIKRYLRDNSSLRISRSLKDIAYKALKLKNEHILTTGKEMPDKDIAAALDVTEYEVTSALEALREPVSMYEPIYNDGGDTIYLYDQLKEKEKDYDLDYHLALNKAMDKLKDREIHILNERYIVGKTQMELASELGISQAQISRIENNSIKVLRKNIK